MRRLTQHTLLSLPLLLASAGLVACSDDSSGEDESNIGSDGTGGGADDFGEEGEEGDELGSDGETGTTGGDTTGDDGWGEDEGTDGGDATDGGELDTGEEGEEEESTSEEETDTTETGDPMCDEETPITLYLSPDDSNSMSSPVQVRDWVLNYGGNSLSGFPIRTWEFMNYYGFDYDPAADGELSVYAAMNPIESEGDEARFQMQIGVASELMTPEERPPMNVTLVLDTSGSMAGTPIELLRETSRAIAAQLKLGDTVSICEWDTSNTWTLAGYAVTGPNDELLLEKINEVVHGGGTDLEGGLTSGYELAQMVYDPDAINRLVLISDGGANAGITDLDLIAENAAYGGSDGIYLVGVGVDDPDDYNDELMDAVTDAGKGASVFMPSEEEVWTTFGDNFESVMAIAAREVQVQLDMPPGFEVVKFSGEEISGDPKEVEPQNLAPNDTMVFYQQVETCAPDLAGEDAEVTVTVTWDDPWTFESQELAQTWTIGELTGMDQALLLKGAAILAYTDALKAFKQAYTNDQKAAALQPALDALALAQTANDTDGDLIEIGQILGALMN